MKYLYGRGTDPQATQAAQANSIRTAGGAGQQHYDRRQHRSTAFCCLYQVSEMGYKLSNEMLGISAKIV